MANIFSNLFGNFFGKKDSIVAIDIGSSAIKLVQIRRDHGRMILETYGELSAGPFGGASVGQAVSLNIDKLTEMLKELIKKANVTTNQAVFAIPLRSSLLINMQIPEIGQKDLDSIISLEARKYVPVPITEVELDWWKMPEYRSEAINTTEADDRPGENFRKIEVMAVAIHKDTLKLYRDLADKLGLSIGSFEIETFSMVRSAIHNDLSPTVVVDFGAGTTKVAVMDYGILRLSHTIGKGSQDLSHAISRSLEVSFEKAEDIKRRLGLIAPATTEQILGSVSPILEHIFADINRVIVNYQTKSRKAVSRIVFTGGGTMLKGFLELAQKNFEMPVEMSAPFERVEYPQFMAEITRKAGPDFAVAIGLAIRKLQDE